MEVLPIDAIERREVTFHVGQKDRDVDDAFPAGPGVLQHGADVLEHGPALLLDVVVHDLALRVERDAGLPA